MMFADMSQQVDIPGYKEKRMEYLARLYLVYFSYPRNRKGQTLVEYALLLVLIAIVVIVALKGLGTSTSSAYVRTNSALQ